MKKTLCFTGILFLLIFASGCAKDSQKAEELMLKGREQFEAGDANAAVAAFNESLEYTDDQKEIFRDLGIAYMELEKYPEAIDNFVKALHSNNGFVEKTDYDINYYLAKAYFLNQSYEDAISVYDALLTVKPKLTDIYYDRATAYLKVGNPEKALEDFDSYTSKSSSGTDDVIKIYFAMKDCGYDKEAKEYLTQALENAPGSTSDYDNGRMCYYLEDYSNARVYLEKAKDMSNPDTILMLGRTYEAIKDFNYAANLYNTYLSARGNNAGVYNQLGKCRIAMQDYSAALLAFESGLNLDDETFNRTLLYNEALTYEYMLDFKNAREKMSEYVALYPRDTQAQREMEFLKTR